MAGLLNLQWDEGNFEKKFAYHASSMKYTTQDEQ
jgi:hypothetical protein